MKVMIVDDHPMVVTELTRLIRQMDAGVEAFGVSDHSEALWQLAIDDYEVVILDMEFDQVDGPRILSECSRRRPAIPVLVMSDDDRTEAVVESIRAGASGYLPKTLAVDDIVCALEVAFFGRRDCAASKAVVRPLFQ